MVRWDKCLVDQASDVPVIILFIIFYRLRALKTIFVKNSARNYKKNNITWNIRPLVDESFVQANQHILL